MDRSSIVIFFQSTLAHFIVGVKANVQLKSNIPIGAKVEISPRALH
jgi:hypothetical protein